MKWFIGIAVLAVAFFLLNNRPVKRSPEEVAELLKARVKGTVDDGAWDYFVSCKVRNPELEKIRYQVNEIEVLGSPYLENSEENPFKLNTKGIERLMELSEQCKKIS